MAYPHFGYESIEVIDDYIGDRTTDQIFVQAQHSIGDKLDSGSISRIVCSLAKPIRAKGFKVSAHSFRKAFMTNVISKGMREPMAKMFVGKKIPQTDNTYYELESALTEWYMRVYPEALAIDNKERDNRETTKKLDQMQTKIDKYEEVLSDDVLEILKQIKA